MMEDTENDMDSKEELKEIKEEQNTKTDFGLEDVTVEFVHESFSIPETESSTSTNKFSSRCKRSTTSIHKGYQKKLPFTYTKKEVREPSKEQMNTWRHVLQAEGQVCCPFPGCQVSYCSLRGLILHYQACDEKRDEFESVKCKICRKFVSCRISLAHHNRLLHRGTPTKSIDTFSQYITPTKMRRHDSNSVKTTKSRRHVRKPVRYRDVETAGNLLEEADGEGINLHGVSNQSPSSHQELLNSILKNRTPDGNSEVTEEYKKSSFLHKMGLKRKNHVLTDASQSNTIGSMSDEETADKKCLSKEPAILNSTDKELVTGEKAKECSAPANKESDVGVSGNKSENNVEIVVRKKRGRPRKNPLPEPEPKRMKLIESKNKSTDDDGFSFDNKSNTFGIEFSHDQDCFASRTTCGVCGKEFTNSALFEHHVLLSHNGLAKPADCDQSFTEEERKEILRRTFKKLGKLLCPQEGCRKPLISLPGFIYHVQNCNKDLKNLTIDAGDEMLLDKNKKQILQQTIKQEGKLVCPNSSCKKALLTITGYINHLKNCKMEKLPIACGKCDTKFIQSGQFQHHAMMHHNGLARPNETNQEFTEEEKHQILRNTFRTLKKLRCLRPQCGKSFISLGGYYYHEKQCGQEDRYSSCPVCGKKLKEFSMKYHMKTSHPPSPPPSSNPKEDSLLDKETENKDPPKRKAAEVAREKVLEIARGMDRQEDNGSKNSDLVSGDNDGNFLPDEEILSMYTKPPPIHISTTLFAEWREELEKNQNIACKNEGCSETFTEPWQMRSHYMMCRCSKLDLFYTCLRCGKQTKTETGIQSHVELHISRSVGSGSDNDDSDDYNEENQSSSKSSLAYSKLENLGNRLSSEKDPFGVIVDWMMKFQRNHYEDDLFSKWKPLQKHWLRLSSDALTTYLPKTRESVAFKSTVVTNSGSHVLEWTKAKIFESSSTTGNGGITFFVGGPVWASAWCPTPFEKVVDQYLAISGHLNMDDYATSTLTVDGPGLIQIWHLVEKQTSPPSLSINFCFGMAHDFGFIWQLEWCPSGCWEDPHIKKGEILSRMGLLAAASSTGKIVLFSVPHPSHVPTCNEPLILKALPMVVLELFPVLESTDMLHPLTQCLSFSWLKSKSHHLIAGGFASGQLAFWDLTTTSHLLRKELDEQTILNPYWLHQAHGSSIHSVQWSPLNGGQFLVTAGMDRQIQMWNTDDLSLPYNVTSRGRVLKVAWMLHWCGVFLAQDDCYHYLRNYTSYMESGYFGNNQSALIGHNGCTWDIALNNWLNCCVSSDSAGEVVGSILCEVMQNISTVKQLSRRRFPIFHSSLELLQENPAIQVDTEIYNVKNNMLTPSDSENKISQETQSILTDLSLNNIQHEISSEIVVQKEMVNRHESSKQIDIIKNHDPTSPTEENSMSETRQLEGIIHSESHNACQKTVSRTDKTEIQLDIDDSSESTITTKIFSASENDNCATPESLNEKPIEMESINSDGTSESTGNNNGDIVSVAPQNEAKVKEPVVESSRPFVTKPSSYAEMVPKYGIHFCDTIMTTGMKLPVSEVTRLLTPANMSATCPNIYPLTSVNRVAWNPNFGFHLFLASGCQSGLARIHPVKWLQSASLQRLQTKLDASRNSDDNPVQSNSALSDGIKSSSSS